METLHMLLNVSIDEYLLRFIGNNFITIGFMFVILKGLAENSAWTWDEKIVNVFWSAFEMLKPNGKKNINAN